MDHSFWHQRWQENRIGFHLPNTNELLAKYLPALTLNKADKIFVPLCGKTLDLLYLKQHGFNVLGNELNALAVNDFFNDNALTYTRKLLKGNTNTPSDKDLEGYYSEQIEIIKGDFFQLEKSMLSGVSAVYDRASMVALPEHMRKEYVRFLLEILPNTIKILLVSLEYDQNLKQGPPFSVSEQEISHYYQNDFDISLLYTQETPMPQRGEVSKKLSMKEKVFLLIKK